MRIAPAALFSLVCLAALGPPARADTTIVEVTRPTPVTAYGDEVVWSAYDQAAGIYRLMHRGADGAVQALPVPGRSVPFDADLGPGPDGKPALVYSRCATEPPGDAFPALDWSRARGCDIYRFDIQTATEEKVAGAASTGVAEFLPAVWRGRVAFAVLRPGATVPGLRLLEPDGRRRALPGPPARACVRSYDRQGDRTQRCGDARNPYLTGVDLRGRTIAFAWQAQAPGADGARYDLFLSTAAGRRLIASSGPGGLTQVVQRWPAFDGGYLTWSEGCFGDSEGCPGRHRFLRYRLSDGSRSSASAPRVVLAQAVSAGRFTYLTASYATTDTPCDIHDAGPPRPCELRQTGRVTFTSPAPARPASCTLTGRSSWPAGQSLGSPAFGTAPALAITPRDEALAVWGTSSPRGRGVLRAAARPPHAAAFHPVGAPGGTGTVGSITVAPTPRGQVIVAWERHIGRNYRLQAAVRSSRGRFGPVMTLSGTRFSARLVRLAVNSRGDALLAWREGPSVHVALRPAGGSFAPGGTVPSRDYATDAALGDDATVVVATTTSELPPSGGRGRHVLQVVERSPSGTWSTPRALDSTVNYIFAPTVAIAGDGTAIVAWSRYGGSGYVAAAATRRVGGDFGPRQVLSGSGVGRTLASSTERDGTVMLAWLREGRTGRDVEATTWSGAFARPKQVSDGRADNWFLAAIPLPAGGSALAWMERCHGRSALFAARRRAGGAFSKAERVTPAGAFTSQSPLAAGRRRFGAAWAVTAGGRTRPQASVRAL